MTRSVRPRTTSRKRAARSSVRSEASSSRSSSAWITQTTTRRWGRSKASLLRRSGRRRPPYRAASCSSPSRLIAGSARSCHGTRGQSAIRASFASSTTRSRTAATMSTEKVWSPYIMAPLDAQLGSATLTGNIGLQGVHTDLRFEPASPFPTAHDHYWMWLPSLNLNFRWENGWVVRASRHRRNICGRGSPTSTTRSVSLRCDQ